MQQISNWNSISNGGGVWYDGTLSSRGDKIAIQPKADNNNSFFAFEWVGWKRTGNTRVGDKKGGMHVF